MDLGSPVEFQISILLAGQEENQDIEGDVCRRTVSGSPDSPVLYYVAVHALHAAKQSEKGR